MEEPSNQSKRYFELNLISKAFVHHITTSEFTRHALLDAFHNPTKPPKPGEDPTTRESKVAGIVNTQLHLDQIDGLELHPDEMEKFDFEMQKRHSEIATPGNFIVNSAAYSSRFGSAPPGSGQGLGVSSTTGQEHGGTPPNES